jgi:N-methylhydantoinase A
VPSDRGRYRLGIDIGGTFTDFSLHDATTGAVVALKTPSTPPAFAAAVRDGLGRLVEEGGVDPREIGAVVHGATIAVNTVIQRTGARVGLLVTAGFRDLLEIQRLRIADPADLDSGRPAPLITRADTVEIDERMLADGTVDRPLDEAGVAAAARALRARGVEAIVVAFLHAYRNPAHERRARAIIQDAVPGLPVNASAEVWPQAREYERAALAAIDAYVRPGVTRYLDEFCDALRERDVPAAPCVTKSNGGIMPVAAARRFTVATLLSGPASGVMGAAYVAGMAGVADCITLDVGGTSADIAVVEGGQARTSTAEHIGDFPLIMPVVGVSSIGAGGGSVAWVDEIGVPKVGPRSTGSRPGPACYGLGGTEATLTDAFVVAGLIDPGRFLGGRMPLRRDLAEEALGRVADAMGTTLPEAAESVVRVAVAAMHAEFSAIIARSAVDPRAFALVPFGGAGPLVGCLVARELGMPLVVVPRAPGTLCALGAITADVLEDAVQSVRLRLDDGALPALAAQYRALEARLAAWLAEHGLEPLAVRFRHTADMRYVGQSYEIEVELDPRWLDAGDRAALAAAFHRGHERRYGHADARAPAEIVDIRVQMRGVMPRVPLAEVPAGSGSPVPRSRRTVRLDGAPVTAAVFARDGLGRGDRIEGPAIVEQDDTTVLVPAGFGGTVDRHGNLHVRRSG